MPLAGATECLYQLGGTLADCCDLVVSSATSIGGTVFVAGGVTLSLAAPRSDATREGLCEQAASALLGSQPSRPKSVY